MSNNNTSRLFTTLLSLGIAPGIAYAAENPDTLAEPTTNEVEFGINYLSDDAYHFGRYNGMAEEGPYLIGNVKAQSYDEDAAFWKLRGTNLGLDSRYLRFDAGVQGKQRYFLEYDQLVDRENNTATTPFTNPGDTDLNLPEGYTYDNLDSYLLPFDQEVEREHLGIGTRLQLKSRWELSGSVSHETREGTDWTGAAMGPEQKDYLNLFQFTTGELLPEPIDFETDKFNAALTYHGKETQFEVAYNGSLFYNNNDHLSWTDPEPYPKATNLYRDGRMSLEPDNQMHQISMAVGHMLSQTTRINALASVSMLTQDDDFLPYSEDDNPASDQQDDSLDALPQKSLDGEVLLYRGQLKLTSRPLRNLRLSAQYDYDERDNRTDSNDYYYILADGMVGDSGGAVPPTNPRPNDPLSYQKQKVDLNADYRFGPKVSLRGGYRYDLIKRDNLDDQVKTTREQTISAKLKVKPLSQLNLELYGESGKRKGSTYYTRDHEHPELRVFYLADLDRNKVGTRINFSPTYRLSFGLSGEYLKDDYTESEIGLKESEQSSALFNVNYQVTDRINTHVFYNYREAKSTNANENLEVEKGNIDVWEADLTDRAGSFGLGLSIDGLAEKWDAGLDWIYTRSVGNISMYGEYAEVDTTTGEIIGDFAPIETQQFNDVVTNLHKLQLWARYKYSDSVAYKLSYWYEHYDRDDWAVEGTVKNYYPLENDTIAQYLFLGEDNLNYTQHVVGLSVNMLF